LSAAIAYAYRYQFSSGMQALPAGSRLRLATWGGVEEHPVFFQGRLLRPRRAADLLRGLMEIVHARFFIPPNMLARILAMADPVVTSSEHRLRFEAFSGCCSTYARVDFLPDAVEGETVGRGTTNVDFNAPLLAALARIRDADRVQLSVGSDELKLGRGEEVIIEKKVLLPLRWLRGFVEVQSYQSRMRQVLEVPGLEAVRFLRSLPRAKTKHPGWIVPSGRGLRLSQTPHANGVRVAGIERLRVLETLAPLAEKLRIFADRDTETAAFDLVLTEARFHLVLSPDVWRGFSGEGQALSTLASGDWREALPKVRAAMNWDAVIDPADLTRHSGFPKQTVDAALSALGVRGLVGFDLDAGAYFHRELPFDVSLLEDHQPRLEGARKLLEEKKIRVGRRTAEQIELFVAGSGVEHRVRYEADAAKCTCPWFSKHQGHRGPCKHILAAEMFLNEQNHHRT
jgi:hypothetical protein